MLAGLPLQNLYLLPFLCIPGLSYLCSNIDVSKRNFIWIRWDRKEMLYGILGFFMQTEMCWGHGLKIAVDFNQALIEKLARMLAEENSKEGVKKRRSKYLRAIPSSKPLKPNPCSWLWKGI